MNRLENSTVMDAPPRSTGRFWNVPNTLTIGRLVLAFFVFLGLLKRTETITLDTDWIYRKGSRLVVSVVTGIAAAIARVCDYIFIQFLPRHLAAFGRRPIGTFMDLYRRTGGDKGSASAAEPELVTTTPAGVPVMFAIGFLFVLAFVFTMLFR